MPGKVLFLLKTSVFRFSYSLVLFVVVLVVVGGGGIIYFPVFALLFWAFKEKLC